MPSYIRQTPPLWFWLVAIALLLWNAMGCYACVQQFRLGADAMGPADDYQRALYATLPVWYNWVYATAVGAGLLGSVALLARSAMAKPLYLVSLIAIVVQFGWLFVTTDMIARRGGATAIFPLVIVAVAGAALWFAAAAHRRGWIV